MDYKEKYERSLERAKKLYEQGAITESLSYVFPELAENDDERIRKNLIELFHDTVSNDEIFIDYGLNKTEVLAWLKKQGKEVSDFQQNSDNVKDCISMCLTHADEQRFNDYNTTLKECIDWLENQGEKPNPYSGTSFEYNGHTWGMCARDYGVEIGIDGNLRAFISLDKALVYPTNIYPTNPKGKSDLEAIKEEKVDNANKIEPKDYSSIDPHFFKTTDEVEPRFKVGDWVLYSGDHYEGVRHITKIDENGYYIERNGLPHGIIPFNHEICMRPWTIQDAKDGDVLTCYSDIKGQPIEQTGIIKQYVGRHGGCSNSFKAHFGVDWDNNVVIEGYMGSSNIYPSTKEQRDALMKAMADVGYTFDFEKKELKLLITNGGDFESENCEQKPAWSEEDDYNLQCMVAKVTSDIQKGNVGRNQELIDWLKSLKDRVQPKQEWSEEDEEESNYIADFIENLIKKEKLVSKKTMIMEEMVDWLKSLKDRVQPKQEWSEEDEKMLKWLCRIVHSQRLDKEITFKEEMEIGGWMDKWLNHKPHPHWKPSDEQMNLLEELMEDNSQRYFYTILRSLYQELKKLRGE